MKPSVDQLVQVGKLIPLENMPVLGGLLQAFTTDSWQIG